MQKNWHILYTKQNSERKVVASLNKKKIESFCAFNCRQTRYLRNIKLVYEPLFDSYVFVNIREREIPIVQQVENVINLVYWQYRPAIIAPLEIEAIKEFTRCHKNIKLENIPVNINDAARIVTSLVHSIDGKMLPLESHLIKVNLPSLGFVMIADAAASNDNSFERKIRSLREYFVPSQ